MKLPVLARSWTFMRPYRGLIALAALGIVGSTLITVAGPALQASVRAHECPRAREDGELHAAASIASNVR